MLAAKRKRHDTLEPMDTDHVKSTSRESSGTACVAQSNNYVAMLHSWNAMRNGIVCETKKYGSRPKRCFLDLLFGIEMLVQGQKECRPFVSQAVEIESLFEQHLAFGIVEPCAAE